MLRQEIYKESDICIFEYSCLTLHWFYRNEENRSKYTLRTKNCEQQFGIRGNDFQNFNISYSSSVTSGISSAWLELGNDFMPENCLVLSGNSHDSIHGKLA